MKMSPLTAVLKCPHYEKGHYSNESERAAEVPSYEDGDRWIFHIILNLSGKIKTSIEVIYD